ncbi:MAG: hypothetical protein KF833_19235 [Verrucomicrobiae bacterium]|nr:hypothetical protein [Verrucomicrobiae bacterium]
MILLRWVLGLIAAGLGGGFLFLIVLSNAFRKSFGASTHGLLFAGLPVVALGLLLGAVVLPGNRMLLHVAALAAVGLVSFCIWQIVTESAVVLWFALAYLAVWFVFYWHAAWRISPPA